MIVKYNMYYLAYCINRDSDILDAMITDHTLTTCNVNKKSAFINIEYESIINIIIREISRHLYNDSVFSINNPSDCNT